MRILRNIVVGSIFGGSALVIAFACVDRLDHPAPGRTAAPVAALTRIRPPEPVVTGSLPAESGPSIGDILGRDAVARATVTRPPVPRTSTTRETTTRETSTRENSTREAAGRPAARPVARVAAVPAKPVKRTAEGFDTERLNALMRGDPAVTLTRSR